MWFLDQGQPKLDEIDITQRCVEHEAPEADAAIITIGRQAGEGMDRNIEGEFNLTEQEKQMISRVSSVFHQQGKPVIVVINSGSVMETASWRSLVDGILVAWQPGEEGGNYNREYYHRLALKKHGYTQADFDTSMVWYYNHLEDLFRIYERVQHRLSEDALAQGTSVRELQQFTKTYSHNSDTTDVWDGKRYLLLYPQAPFHVYQFKQKADSTYHAGDSFLFTYNSNFLVQSGSRNANVFLTMTFENDSVVTRNYAVPPSGMGTIRIDNVDYPLKELRGYIIMNRRDSRNMENEVCMLFLDRIQLLRIRKKQY